MRVLEEVVREVVQACPVEERVMPFRFWGVQELPGFPQYAGLLGLWYKCRGCGTTALYQAQEEKVIGMLREYVVIPELDGEG